MPQTTNTEVAKQLYDGLTDGRLDDVVALFTPDFHAVLASGMPNGIGGGHEGPAGMRSGVYEAVGDLFEMWPAVDEVLEPEPDRLVIVGRYCGTARNTGREIEAAFVHFLRFRDGMITELIQVTDTAEWHRALGVLADEAVKAPK
jgi:ketosteroid isomerase-like protein